MRFLVFLLLVAVACADSPAPAETSEETESVPPPCVADWRPVTPGIDYRTLNCSLDRNLHLVRLDPKRVEIGAVLRGGATAETIAREGGWTVVINANFFDHDFRPLGLVVSGGNQLNRLHPVEWESVFFVTKDSAPRIVLPADWRSVASTATVALQAGPRIVVEGKPLKVVPGRPDSRSGVCIDAASHVVLFVTTAGSLFTALEAADLAAGGGLGCRNAMLFDGGPSTQLFVGSQPAITLDGDKAVPAFLVARQAPPSHYK